MYPTIIFCVALLFTAFWVIHNANQALNKRKGDGFGFTLLILAVFFWGWLYYLSH